MPVATDPKAKFAEYAHPEVLVSVEWLAENLQNPDVVIVESDEDVLLYEVGHIPGSVKIDWHVDLNDPVTRNYIDGEAFKALMERSGISRDTTIVVYGDKSNWWAAYALWVFKLFGHADVRLLDGGRQAWIESGKGLTREVAHLQMGSYPIVERDDKTIRAFRDDVLKHFGNPLLDIRSPQEYSGERTHMPDYPQEGALRGGHIPTAVSVPWARAVNEDQTFKTREDLDAIYLGEKGLAADQSVIAYCRIGERSSHSWFVLKYLLGFENVRNYDGSWTEWGNLVGVPIHKGEDAGEVPVLKN
jgi:thiosulfate/3-mercaptopyruvate sulfurtransferase